MTVEFAVSRLPGGRAEPTGPRPPLPRAFLRYLEREKSAGRPVRLRARDLAGLRAMGRTDLIPTGGMSPRTARLANAELSMAAQRLRMRKVRGA